MATFPRLRVTDGSVIPPGAPLPVGTRFMRVDPPNDYSHNPIFRTWRIVTWEVVPHRHKRWNIETEKYEVIDTTAFVVYDEDPLTADEIAWWEDWLVGQRRAA